LGYSNLVSDDNINQFFFRTISSWRLGMSAHIKKNVIVGSVLFITLFCGVVYFVLTESTFYAGIVAQKVADAFAEAGYSLEIDSIRGNPLTGVEGHDVRVIHGDTLVAKADEIEIRPLLSSVFSSSPKLSILAFRKLTADYNTISAHLPEQSGESSAPPALETLALYDSSVSTPWGEAEFRRLIVAIDATKYKISYNGKFCDSDVSIIASAIVLPQSSEISSLKAEWNGMKVSAKGTIAPLLSLDCAAQNLDVVKIAEVVPSIKDAGVEGVFDTNLNLTYGNAIRVAGNLTSQEGAIKGILYDELAANYAYLNGHLTLNDVRTSVYDASLTGAAAIDISKSGKPELSLIFQARDLKPDNMVSDYPWLEGINGTIDLISCDISGASDSLSGPINIYASKINALDFDFEKITGKVYLKDTENLRLSLFCGALGAAVRANGDIAISPETVLDLDVSAKPVSLEALSAKYPEIKKAGAFGDVTLTAKIKGPARDFVVTGLASSDALVVSGDIELQKVSSEFEYSSDGFFVKSIDAEWDGAYLTATGAHAIELGALEEGISPESLKFNGNMSGLRLASLHSFVPRLREYGIDGTVSADWNLSGTVQDPIVGASLKIPSLTAGGQNLSNFNAALSYKAGSLDILSVSCSYGKAKLSAGGFVKLPEKNSLPEYNIKGSFSDVEASLLNANGVISEDIGGELAGDFRVWEDKKSSGARVFFRDSKLTYRNLQFSDINGSAALADGVLTFEKLRSRTNIGNLGISARVANLPEPGNWGTGDIALDELPIDIQATASSADIGRISRLFMPGSRGYQGFLTGSADITGTVADPKFKANALFYGVRAFGLFLPFIRVESVSGDMREIQIPKATAAVGRGLISADATLVKSGDEWGGNIRATGRSVDIRSLMAPLDYERKIDVAGSLNFDFAGNGSASSFEGKGKAVIPNLSVMGARFSMLEAPFWVTEGYFLIEDSSAVAYGGKVNAQLAKDIRMSDWGGTLHVKSADIASALMDLVPDAEGVVSGSADLRIHLAGDTRRTSMLNGDGRIEIKKGGVSGFSGAVAVSKLLGGKPLRFDALNASFTVDGKTLYLLPGSRVSAPKGDPVFNYIMADGSISMEKDVNLFCVGNVNIRALNSFVGGVRGLVSSAMDQGSSGLTFQNFLGGAITGFAKDEFRDVSLSVIASSSDVSIEKVVISEPVKKDLAPELNEAERRREKNDEMLRLNLEFPVGPGGDEHRSGLGSQIGGQVLEHALNGLLSF
jgi:uncharacterized protein involved in outer membrane biogenesis